MRIIEVQQGSEEWDRWRRRPTASNFHRIVTPVKGELSTQCWDYACELVAKENDAHEPGVPTYWMERGTEMEPEAMATYAAMMDVKVEQVGFCLPDDTDLFGCSPDGLVESDGLVEIKCLKAENVLAYKCGRKKLPNDHKPQVQGQLLITGRAWCDVFFYHPSFVPHVIRVYPDLDYQAKLLDGLKEFLGILQQVREASEPTGRRMERPTDMAEVW